MSIAQTKGGSLAPCTCVYLLSNDRGCSYVGATVCIDRRVRQHNESIVGGARQTRGRGPWRVVLVVEGFVTWRDALRFEFAWRRRNARRRGIAARLSSLKQQLVASRGVDEPVVCVRVCDVDADEVARVFSVPTC